MRTVKKPIDFKVTEKERELINKIVARVIPMGVRAKVERHHADWFMDIAACHLNGTPLDLEKLLAADDANFAHDVFGIRHHIDRSTGRIMDFFLPRSAA